ncbi:class I SAM-dependent methyltransferase [Denitrobaculum tricleocarpae]|uniref:Ribosomal RNA adenine methylase transferase N-terminal domain-containing protein n=1 Tax=Denitrobaculum tricleocarpae TaxID=2591009 RepID=A0A545U1U3_9PROT|nr:hypothetical protein [Denitrobaculum tricleocarpae]TQV83428.1 hypothetical protein FKG95_02195 [Denitrobaculum tricleocarpae]
MKPTRSRANWLFFRQWLRNPFSIGAVMPSGRELANAMAEASDSDSGRFVVELGGGTGNITQALLDSGLPAERLIVIERDRRLYRVLAARFPEIRILNMDAVQALEVLNEECHGKVGSVVSGLPLLSMPPEFQEQLLAESFKLLGKNGDFIQFTYGPVSPVSQRRLGKLGLRAQKVSRARLNIPPASVWRFVRISEWLQATRDAAQRKQNRAANAA